MELSEFIKALSDSLLERGVSREKINEHIGRLTPSLSEEDLQEIASFNSPEDFCDISDSTAEMILSMEADKDKEYDENITNSTIIYGDGEDEDVQNLEKDEPHIIPPEKKRRFAAICAASSPLWILGFALYALLWIFIYAFEAAVMAFAICACIVSAAAGCASSISGIIYGIVILSTEHSVGVYEIGFGIVLAGVALLSSVLLYNFAVRLMPFAFRKTSEHFKFCLGKVRELIGNFKRRCIEK